MNKKLVLLAALFSASVVARASTPTPTNTVTPSNTPTITPTLTATMTEVPNPNGAPDYNREPGKGYRGIDGAVTTWGSNWGDSGVYAVPFKKHNASPALAPGDCVALVAGTAGLVSKTGSAWDQGYMGVCVSSQYYDGGRVYVARYGVYAVKSAISATSGDILIPTTAGVLTGTGAVTAGLFTSLSKTPKLYCIKSKTISGSDNRVLCTLHP